MRIHSLTIVLHDKVPAQGHGADIGHPRSGAGHMDICIRAGFSVRPTLFHPIPDWPTRLNGHHHCRPW
jgi:hypothetical protein